MKKRVRALLIALVMTLTLFTGMPLSASAVEGIWKYTIYNNEATVTGCIQRDGDLVIPDTLGGYPVTAIEYDAFLESLIK